MQGEVCAVPCTVPMGMASCIASHNVTRRNVVSGCRECHVTVTGLPCP